MRALLLSLAVTIAVGAPPASAAVGIYCAASDDVLKLSIESAFSARDGRKLVHFRGIADVVAEKAPAAFHNLKLNSGMLKQSWVDNDELRLQIYTDTRSAEPFEIFELSILTTASGKNPQRLTGRYMLRLSAADTKKTAPRDILLSHEATVFCDIK
ncbi:hypothetical protein [Rhizobium sp. CAU 1783]